MLGVEVGMVVSDSPKALELYEKIFDAERVEVTNYERGNNEVVCVIYGTRFHLLDENREFMLFAPKPDEPKSTWVNVVVPDIRETWARAVRENCVEVQPVTELEDFGVLNAMFTDPFGHLWMLHEVVREVSFEERYRIIEKKMKHS